MKGIRDEASGRVDAAKEAYADSIRSLEQALALDPDDERGVIHYSLALSLTNLAKLYHVNGQYAEAEPLYQRALAISEQQLEGPEHPSVARSLHNLAALYVLQRRFSEAEQLLDRAMAISSKIVGPGHPDTASIVKTYKALATGLEKHAILLRNSNRGAEAAKLEAHAKAIRAKHAEREATK